MKKLEITDWNKADKDETIHVPDELDKVFSRVGMQIRFHTISGKNEVQTIADIVHGCQEFFKKMYDVEDGLDSGCYTPVRDNTLLEPPDGGSGVMEKERIKKMKKEFMSDAIKDLNG